MIRKNILGKPLKNIQGYVIRPILAGGKPTGEFGIYIGNKLLEPFPSSKAAISSADKMLKGRRVQKYLKEKIPVVKSKKPSAPRTSSQRNLPGKSYGC